MSFWGLFLVSIVGGALGGLLLLRTPSTVFARLVPWLVLFATAVFAWGSFVRKSGQPGIHLERGATITAQFLISIYGGYFGGGIGFLMMAALSMAGLQIRNAAATKNALAAVMNASAVALFLASPLLHFREALVLGAGAIAGGQFGVWALRRVNEKALQIAIVCLGTLLSIGLFVKPV